MILVMIPLLLAAASLQGLGDGITPDGRTVIGNGTNPDGKPEGWVARLP
jgi:hypothetical protein